MEAWSSGAAMQVYRRGSMEVESFEGEGAVMAASDSEAYVESLVLLAPETWMAASSNCSCR